MKSWKQMVCASSLVLAGLGGPIVSAQEDVNVAEVVQGIQSAYETPQAFHGEGTIHFEGTLEGESLGSGHLENQLDVLVDPELAFHHMMSGVVNQTDEEGKTIEEEVTLDQTLVDNVLYQFDGKTWSVEEVDADDFKPEEDTQDVDTDALVSFVEKYFDTYTEGDVIGFTLKEDIDADAFWKDLGPIYGVESLKDEALDEAVEDDASEAERQQIQDVIDTVDDILLDTVKHLDIQFAKDTYKLRGISLDLSVQGDHMTELMGVMGASLGSLDLTVSINLAISDLEEGTEITVPEAAPELPAEGADDVDDTEEAEEADNADDTNKAEDAE